MSENGDFYRRIGETEQDVAVVMSKMESHERICAERYAGIAVAHGKLEQSIGHLNSRLLYIGTFLLGGMGSILVKILFFSGTP